MECWSVGVLAAGMVRMGADRGRMRIAGCGERQEPANAPLRPPGTLAMNLDADRESPRPEGRRWLPGNPARAFRRAAFAAAGPRIGEKSAENRCLESLEAAPLLDSSISFGKTHSSGEAVVAAGSPLWRCAVNAAPDMAGSRLHRCGGFAGCTT